VAGNIRLGEPTASDERVLEAAALAGADSFVRRLPAGYETVVGDGGRALSAGECRRLALARAFLRSAPLVVLDEPTADLDPASAERVAAAVDRLRATVLLIAHRRELVGRADRVVVLAGGTAAAAVVAGASPARLGLAVLLGAATVALGVGLMASAGYLISRAAEQPPILSLTVAIVAVRFFGLARPVVRYAERLAGHDVALRALARVRTRVYERIEPLAPGGLGSYRSGDLVTRMVADVESLQNLHLRGVVPPLVALLSGAVSVAVAAAILPAAAAVLAAGLAAGAIAVPAAAAALARRGARVQAPARGELSAELVELLAGASELVVYGAQDERLRRLRERDGRLVHAAHRAALAEGAGDGLRILVTGGTVAAVLAVAVSAHAAGHLDRVLIALLPLLALASFEAVQPLAQAARQLAESLAAGRRILALTEREPGVSDPDVPAPPAGPLDVALEDVVARYGPDEPRALDGFSLRLEAGQRVALLGRSGAGKTTVANLLLRFLDPERGRVTLAGRDLREYRQEDVRRAIAVAGQNAHLFSTSIRDNVLLGRPAAGDAELQAALRRARIWDWVRSLPDGWDTLVGEQGRELSGGQRQRIVLARALLVDAPVLVLDEPTAHLDPATAERLIADTLDAAGDSSVLLITHRPEGLEHVDDVLVLA
jgi:thiol reductant ABC exporter CydC subunit